MEAIGHMLGVSHPTISNDLRDFVNVNKVPPRTDRLGRKNTGRSPMRRTARAMSRLRAIAREQSDAAPPPPPDLSRLSSSDRAAVSFFARELRSIRAEEAELLRLGTCDLFRALTRELRRLASQQRTRC